MRTSGAVGRTFASGAFGGEVPHIRLVHTTSSDEPTREGQSMTPVLFRLAAIAGLLTAGVVSSQEPARPAAGPSLDRPCSFATASEMAGLLGTPVATASDEHFRCKYVVGKGWLETKLMNIELKATRDIYDYNKAHG